MAWVGKGGISGRDLKEVKEPAMGISGGTGCQTGTSMSKGPGRSGTIPDVFDARSKREESGVVTQVGLLSQVLGLGARVSDLCTTLPRNWPCRVWSSRAQWSWWRRQ